METLFKWFGAFWVVGVVLAVAFWASVGYVAFHFISKWW